jgi:CelD/BcsL family acetyltransferase involved in cellulose biosynthesis
MLGTLQSGSDIRDAGSGARELDVTVADGSRIPDPGTRLAVDLVTDYAAFVALEAEWNDTVDRARVPHPFLRHEWVRTWWDSFGSNHRLHILVVRDGGRIIAIAPLMREAATVYGVPVRRIAFLANDHTPRTDVIIADRPDQAYRAIWSALVEEIDQWDVLQLTQLPRTSPTLDAVSKLAAAEGLATGTWQSSDSPYLELAGTWDGYWASLPSKFRSNIRNRMSRLRGIGEPALEILTDRAAIQGACDDAWKLEASGWKQEEGTSICSDPAVHRFYTLLTERATERGWLRLLFLTVGGRRIAVSYSACYDGRLFLFKTGYDPEYHTCSPFKLLTWFATQDAFAHGMREVDFLGDSEPWKQEWTPAARGHDWLFVFSNTRRARLLHSIKFQMAPELKKWRA